MILTSVQKSKISKSIKEVESKSGAELVAVIAKKSGDYFFVWLALALFFMFILSIFFILFLSKSIFLLLNLQIIVLTIFYIFFIFFEDYCIRYLPKFFKFEKSSKFAFKSFNLLGINKIKTRKGVMFFVSVNERYVKIVPDKEISKKIEDLYWENIVKNFLYHVNNGDFAKGYIKAIEECKDILIEKFPITNDDKNELSDEVIEL